jgi:peptide/nickel transport system substrate-binding protein
MVMNQLHPPFNNPKIRQAVLKAVNQDKFMAAMGYPKDMRVTNCATFFICGSAHETFAGAEPWRTPDVAKAKQMLADAGYKGEKVVLLVPSDITYLNAEALMAAQTMRSIGMNVDMQTADWASIGARRAKKDAPDAGGWNMYVTVAGSFDADSPITNAYLSASCGTPLPGWPCDKKLDELRTEWIKETNPAKRKQLLDEFHARAFEALPYISVGQFSPAMAARKELKGLEHMGNGLPTVWYLDK